MFLKHRTKSHRVSGRVLPSFYESVCKAYLPPGYDSLAIRHGLNLRFRALLLHPKPTLFVSLEIGAHIVHGISYIPLYRIRANTRTPLLLYNLNSDTQTPARLRTSLRTLARSLDSDFQGVGLSLSIIVRIRGSFRYRNMTSFLFCWFFWWERKNLGHVIRNFGWGLTS